MRKKKLLRKEKIEGRRFCLCFCLEHTYTPEKKNLAAGRKKQKTTNLYTRVSRCTTIDILWSVGEKKDGDRDRKKKKQHSFPIRKEY